MTPAAKPYPVVIERLVAAVLAAAKQLGVSGRLSVLETDADFIVALRVPKGETVPTRAS